MKRVIYFLVFLFILTPCFSKKKKAKKVFSPTLVNLQISNSVNENKQNEKLLPNQVTNTEVDSENKKKFAKLKQQVETIQGRLTKLSYIVDAAKLTKEASVIIGRIKDNQQYVINEVLNKPAFAFIEIKQGIQFAEQTELMVRYLIGVLLTGSDIAAMDNKDRKVITNFILQELRNMELTSQNMCMLIRNAKTDYLLKQSAFKNWVSRDKEIVKEIIKNAKNI